MFRSERKLISFFLAALLLLWLHALNSLAQATRSAAVERGSQTAKSGFSNEDDIRDKFNEWQKDEDAKEWLYMLGHDPAHIFSVRAFKPHGQKADVVVEIVNVDGSITRHGISIKLVSGATGFNQVDKRWLRQYARMWDMPAYLVTVLRLFLGEDPPLGKTRRSDRMFLNELDKVEQAKVLEFFSDHKDRVVSDILRGEGQEPADWLMVAQRTGKVIRWVLRPIDEAIAFYSEGPVEITRSGSLRIGRVTMQRKGGDGGRETAQMLQFKIDPVLMFSLRPVAFK